MSGPWPPPGLSPDVLAVCEELLRDHPRAERGPALEAYAGQVARLREAQRRIAEDGLITADARGNPCPRPAIAIERAAQDEVRRWQGVIDLG